MQTKKIIDRFKLNNKVAIITGGTRGIGLAIAHALGEAGARLIVSSRTDKYGGFKSLQNLGTFQMFTAHIFSTFNILLPFS